MVTSHAKFINGRDLKPWKVTTFFFSHFPNSYGERDMLKIFNGGREWKKYSYQES